MSNQTGIIVLDYGSQYTQLIARRIRESRVYCEIHPYTADIELILSRQPSGLILSGGPESVLTPNSPSINSELLHMGVPILGLCYGMQLVVHKLGGKLGTATSREYGKAAISTSTKSLLLEDVEGPTSVWMSHGDHVESIPPGFVVSAWSNGVVAAIENTTLRIFGLQFHPEVSHTKKGRSILNRFLFDICGCKRNWSISSFIRHQESLIRNQVGSGRVICGLSGGVDSTVAATLVHRAVGEQQTCIFVNNGLLRRNEYDQVLERYRALQLNVVGVDACDVFLDKLSGVTDPERKRKIIGQTFIEVFEAEASRLGKIDFLVQGTLYPDVIESVSVKGPSAVIKSHHNVGGLPEIMNLRLVEPLRELFKDEVRRVGRRLGLPDIFIRRQPFPGPGLAVRLIGPITRENLAILRSADEIIMDEIRTNGFYNRVWQSFAVLLPVRSVGVMGDGRTYENTVAVRAVRSVDGMTAEWVRLPYRILERISSRIVNEVPGVNRVVYDISNKPPSTIEWE